MKPFRSTFIRVERLESRVTPADLYWTGNTIGKPQVWSDPQNWGGQSVAAFDTVHFQATVNGSPAVLNSICDTTVGPDAIVIDSSWTGHIQISQTLITSGASSWAGKNSIAIDPLNSWIITGPLAIDGSLEPLLAGGEMNAGKTVTLTGTGNLRYQLGARITNNPGCDWTFLTNAGIDYVGGGSGAEPIFYNGGRIIRAAATGETKIEGSFQGGHLIDVQGGTLNLFPDGATSGHTSGGIWTVAPGATLNLTGGGTRKMAGSYDATGGGTILFSGGTIHLGSTKTDSIDNGMDFNAPDGMFRWTGGTMTQGYFQNVNRITIESSASASPPTLGTNSLFANKGGAKLTITGNDSFVIRGTSVIENPVSNTIEIQGNPRIDYQGAGAAPIVMNSGLIRRSAGTGTAYLEGDFRNEGGTIQVETGTLTLFPDSAKGVSTGGTFSVATGAILDLTGGNINESRTLQGSYVGTGGGRVQLTGGTLSGGTGATFNFPAGLFHWTDGYLAGPVTNTGILTVGTDIGSPTLEIGAALTNQGTLTVTGSYDLFISSGSTLDNQAKSTLDLAGNVELDWLGSAPAPIVINSGVVRRSAGTGVASIQGDFRNLGALIQVDTGTLTLSSGSGAEVVGLSTGGTFNVATGATLDLVGFSSHTRTLQGTYTGSGGGTVHFSTGTLFTGTGATFNFPPGYFLWTGGKLGGGTLSNASHMTIDTDTFTPWVLGGATFRNQYKVVATGNYYLEMVPNAAILNDTDAEWEITGDFWADWTQSGPPPVFTNRGLIRRSAGTGVARFEGDFRNEGGTLQVDTGTLLLFPDTAPFGVSTGGTFKVAAGAMLNLTGGQTRTLQGAYAGTGGGIVTASGGQISTGTGATFNFPAGMLQWNGAVFDSGTLTNTGAMAFLGSSTFGASAKFDNQGVVSMTEGVIALTSGAVTTNNTSGVWDIAGDGYVYWATGSVVPAINNQGLVRKSAGTGISYFDGAWTNSGTVQVLTGILQLDYGSMTSTGSLDIASGAVFRTPATTTIAGGVVKGSGTIADPVINTGGSLRPGASPGTLTVSGNYSQSDPGQFDVELNGTAVGEFDQLKVTGTVSLGGPLTVVVGYAAKTGDSFLILDNDGSDAITGTFQDLPAGKTFTVDGVSFKISYTAGSGNDVGLTVTGASPTPGVTSLTINGGATQRSRITQIDVAFSSGTDTAVFQNPGAVTLTRTAGGPATVVTIGSGLLVSPGAGTSSAIALAFTPTSNAGVDSASLADGRWQLAIPSLNYTSMLNNATLRRLFGDADANGTVDGTDFAAFGGAFGTTGMSVAFDFDNNNTIDGADFAAFGGRFGVTL